MCTSQGVRARTSRPRPSTQRLDGEHSQEHYNQPATSPLKYRRFRRSLYMILFAILGLLELQQAVAAVPQREPNKFLKVGDDFNVTCEDVDNYPAYFVYNGTTYNITNSDVVKKIAEHTYVFYQKNATKQSETVTCYSGSPAAGTRIIHTTVVTVGTLPEGGKDLRCISHNFSDLECSFRNPNNTVATNYSIYWEQLNDKRNESCVTTSQRVKCRIGYHRFSQPSVKFVLYGNNWLHTENMVLHAGTLNVADIVIPSDWEIGQVNAGIDSVFARFYVPNAHEYYNLSLPLRFEVNVTSANGSYQDSRSLKNDGRGTQSITIDRLPYANWNYTLSLGSHVSNAPDMRSNGRKVNFTTKPAIPYRAPAASPNGFAVNSDGTITVYWTPLNRSEHNAIGFGYLIERDGEENITTTNPSVSLASGNGFPYSLKIRSINNEGASADATQIDIKRDANLPPLSFRVVAYKDRQIVSWERLAGNEAINYAVFWCTRNKTNYIESFDFVQITDPMLTDYGDVPLKATNVGVATYSSAGSSGIQWAPCVWKASDTVPQINPTVVYKERSLEVKWNLPDKFCPSIVKSYVITYCAAANCKQLYVNDTSENNATVWNVLPFTEYTVRMYIHTYLGKNGKISNVDRGRTEEAEPTAPQNLTVNFVGTNQVTFQFAPPAESNGVIRKYTLYYGLTGSPNMTATPIPLGDNRMETANKGNISQQILYPLEHLDANSDYTIYVEAENGRKSSPHSRAATFRTKPGITQMSKKGDPSAEGTVGWSRPQKINSPSHFYVVMLVREGNGLTETVTRQFTLLDGNCTECKFTPPDCKELKNFQIWVRLVSGMVPESDFDKNAYPNQTECEAAGEPAVNYNPEFCSSSPAGFKDASAYSLDCLSFISSNLDKSKENVLHDPIQKVYYLQSDWLELQNVKCTNRQNQPGLLMLIVAVAVLTMTTTALGGAWKLRQMMQIGLKYPIEFGKYADSVDNQNSDVDKRSNGISITVESPVITNVLPQRAGHHCTGYANDSVTYPQCDGYADDCGSDEPSTESTQSSAADANDYELRSQNTTSSALANQTTSKTYTDMSAFSQRTHDDCSVSLGEHSSASDSGSSSLERSHEGSLACESPYVAMYTQRPPPVSVYVQPDAVALLPGTPSPVQTPHEPFVMPTPAVIRNEVPHNFINSYVTHSQLNEIGQMIRDSKRNELA